MQALFFLTDCDKIVLRQHRTMGTASFGASFDPIVQYEKWEIQKYSPIFHTFACAKTLAESPCPIMRYCLKRFCRNWSVSMKYLKIIIAAILSLLLCGCAVQTESAQIAATTLPVWEFSSRLCAGTPISVTRLVTEQVSCLHDYSLNVRQVKAAEAAETIVISGAGLEDFLDDLLVNASVIDASEGIDLLCGEEHEEEQHHEEGHHHEEDPHIWLAPENAQIMARNICNGLSSRYPQYAPNFEANLSQLLNELTVLQQYGEDTLSQLKCRDLITFHDGFSYFAEAFDLNIVKAVEEESGSEASAQELIELINLVENKSLPAIFTESSGSTSAAGVISRETGCGLYTLDMAMSGDSYFDAMYHNIDTIKEALG